MDDATTALGVFGCELVPSSKHSSLSLLSFAAFTRNDDFDVLEERRPTKDHVALHHRHSEHVDEEIDGQLLVE